MKRVLLVEDDDADAGLVDEAVRRYGMALRLERVASAETAWDFLRRRALNRARLCRSTRPTRRESAPSG